MIEILFGESEAASMKAAKSTVISIKSDGPTVFFSAGKKKMPQRESAGWIEGNSSEVICLALKLDIGELQGETRDTENVYVDELERLKRFLKDGEEIRIWYSKSAYSLCGLYYVCHLLTKYQNKVYAIELPEYRVSGKCVTSYQNWGEVAAEEFSLFLDRQIEIDRVAIKRYACLWTELVEDNSPLRAMVNNHVVGVPEEFYDFLIWKNLEERTVKEARLIGDILGRYPICVGDGWYAKRIQHFIDLDLIEVVEDSENKYARTIRRK